MNERKIESKKFRLLNHDNELTHDLIIGKVYYLNPSHSKTRIKKHKSWHLNIDNETRVFTDRSIHKYFQWEDTNLIGYGQTYDDI